MKMNLRICGFHRRVWCPKWTPASSRSFIVMSATEDLLRGFASAPGVGSRLRAVSHGATPARTGWRERWNRLTLAELEALARARLSVLLALLHARVAREEAVAAEQSL